MKFIRESRMGPPKSFKTGAIVGTYPKPLLYLGFDRGGLDVVPPKSVVLPPDYVKFDVRYEEIVHARADEMSKWLAAPEQPRVLAFDFTVAGVTDLDMLFKPAAMSKPLQDFTSAYNTVSAHLRAGRPLPWKTVVFDSITGYEDIILNHISSFNPSAMGDARQWAGQTGAKVRATILSLTSWPCHVACILHTMIDKSELTGMIAELPSVFSAGLRNDINGLFSQVFYATKQNGKPVLWTTDQQLVRGIGPRFPAVIANVVAPDFASIYGKENL